MGRDHLALGALLALTLAGCAPPQPTPPRAVDPATSARATRNDAPPPPSPPRAAGVVVSTVVAAEAGDAAAHRGTLIIDGCVYLKDATGGRLLLVFSKGAASWNSQAGELIVNGKRFHHQQAVTVGGSETAVKALQGQWDPPEQAQCTATRAWVVNGMD